MYLDFFVRARPGLMDTNIKELNALGQPIRERQAPTIQLWLAEDTEDIWEQFGPSTLHENNAYEKWSEDWNTSNGYDVEKSAVNLCDSGCFPVTTSETLIETVVELNGSVNVRFHPMTGGADPELAWKSIRLVTSRVASLLDQESIDHQIAPDCAVAAGRER